MFGLTFEKLLIIGVIAIFLLGPERLPGYAAKLGQLVKGLRNMASGAKERMRDEMGPEFDEIDWKKLDPRSYDPRRIIRDALLDDDILPQPTSRTRTPNVSAPQSGESFAAAAAAGAGAAQSVPGATEPPAKPRRASKRNSDAVPFDAEAT